MGSTLFRAVVLVAAAGALCATLAAAPPSSSCCPAPGSESSDPYAYLSNSNEVGEYFEQTVGDYTSNPAGHHVRERNGDIQGTNSCWFSGSDIAQYPTPSGGTWLIQSNEEWGPDFIGLGDKGAEQIWTKYKAGVIKLPCTVTTYANMEIECDSGRWQPYLTNTFQSRTIDSSKDLKACRISKDVCGVEIPIY